MRKLPLPFNLPLRVRGRKGVILHNSPCPSYLKRGKLALFPSYPFDKLRAGPSTSLRTSLKRGILGKTDEIRVLRWQNGLGL